MSHFTLPYAEYDVALCLQKLLRPSGIAVSVPLSRQQKGYDLVLHNPANGRGATVQVKSSRVWPARGREIHQYFSWFNRFDPVGNPSDYFALYMSYPLLDKHRRPGARWDRKILLFSRDEMAALLAAAKTKAGKSDRFFGLAFDEGKRSPIFPGRGLHDWAGDFSAHVLEKVVPAIRAKLCE